LPQEEESKCNRIICNGVIFSMSDPVTGPNWPH